MFRNHWAACIAGAGLVLVEMVGPSVAAPLTFAFEGFIDFTADNIPLDDSVTVGTSFVGGYTFDPNGVMDIYPDDIRVGSYSFGSAGMMWFEVGNYTFESQDLGMLIWNNVVSTDLYEVLNQTPFYVGPLQFRTMSLALLDRRGGALASDGLPLIAPDLADWPDSASIVFNWQDHTVTMRGRLTSLTPEPSSLTLLGLGAVIIVVRGKRS